MYRPHASCNNLQHFIRSNDRTAPATPKKHSEMLSGCGQPGPSPSQSAAPVGKRALHAREDLVDLISQAGQDTLEAILTLFGSHECPPYDIGSITARRRLLKQAVKYEDAEELLFTFRTLVTRNIGGIGNPYIEAPDLNDRKHAFNRYKMAVLETTAKIHELFEACEDREDRVHIYEVVCDTIAEFGKSATLLSGGGTLGMYHIGVLKSFRATHPRLISQVISGASAGSIVASVYASKRDEDLDDAVQKLCHGDLDVFVGAHEQDRGLFETLRGMLHRRSLYDPKNLERVMKDLLGEKLTFLDAFNLTGKRLNITVSTTDGDKDDFRLLNYITSPEVLIWSAVVASCAVPFAFPSGQLYYRDTDMIIKKVDTPVGHLDGSIYGDVPMDRMSKEFNVNYFVVSQVNPHVVPFLNTNKTLQRWFPYAYFSATKKLAKAAIVSVLEPLKETTLLGQPVFGALGSIFHQRYEGDLTLFPVRLAGNTREIFKCLSNPTHEFMDRAVENGEKEAERMLPKAHAVLDVEMMLQDLKVQLKTELKFSKSEENLHRKAIEDRMQSRRSYTALSRRGGGRHGSVKSVALPPTRGSNSQAHRTSQSLELGYMQRNVSAEKVAGSECSSDAVSTSSVEEEDSGNDEPENPPGLRIAMPSRNLQRFSSNPPSPMDTRRQGFFPPSSSSSRASSPGDPRASMSSTLRMTPRTPSTRSLSPEQHRKVTKREREREKPASAPKSWHRKLPSGLRTLVDMQSGIANPLKFRLGGSFPRKRSLSAGGLDEWVHERQRDEVKDREGRPTG